MSWEKFRKEHENNKKSKPFYHRNFEIDYVLKYLPDLSYVKGKQNVLDVGCCDSRLIHEIAKRNYDAYGVDIRDYNYELTENITFIKADILEQETVNKLCYFKFFYIVAMSTIEHIGMKAYSGKILENGDRLALENIHKLLHDNGYFIITVPLEYWHTDSGRGYSHKDFLKLISGLFNIVEITHCGGQLCATLVKS